MKRIHKTAAIIAFLLIVSFFSSSLLTDIFGDYDAISQVKNTILYSVGLLVIAMMTTGITANKLYGAKAQGALAVKQKRMKVAAANGVVILIPAAIFLARWSAAGQFDSVYWTVQAIELIAGATNAILLGLNIRDGIRLSYAKPR
ncbi:hypothetical protein [Photobacterium profundum]|uniref:Uncharacterized protein n=1 Tax=Photobacterium profundum 3TCK TaxID=314280 RepID=Q1Z902_9GAMM|nr:hypothetical protein [Photobacterium profundum]EAS44956.1 hypothetical protein P3TCK_20770 [Photobacterium profundum 3TCK]